jgi:hypothetical protein
MLLLRLYLLLLFVLLYLLLNLLRLLLLLLYLLLLDLSSFASALHGRLSQRQGRRRNSQHPEVRRPIRQQLPPLLAFNQCRGLRLLLKRRPAAHAIRCGSERGGAGVGAAPRRSGQFAVAVQAMQSG